MIKDPSCDINGIDTRSLGTPSKKMLKEKLTHSAPQQIGFPPVAHLVACSVNKTTLTETTFPYLDVWQAI